MNSLERAILHLLPALLEPRAGDAFDWNRSRALDLNLCELENP